MIEVRNLAQVNDGLEAWLDACEELADNVYRGLALHAFEYILQGTPQWTGNLAATWRLTVGAPAGGYSETIFKEAELGVLASDREPYSKQDPNVAALHYAREIARAAAREMRLGAPAFITNTAPYAWNVEQDLDEKGQPFVRLINLPVEMVNAAADKFSVMGQISEMSALALAKEAL